MSRTRLQEQAQQLHSFVLDHIIKAGHDRRLQQTAAALGVRLLHLMWTDRSQEFINQTRDYYEQAMGLFKHGGFYETQFAAELAKVSALATDDEIKKFRGQMQARAKIFEEQKQPKQANFLRVIVCVCSALSADRHGMGLEEARACVKAWYAGADLEQIKATVMLLY